MTLTALLITVLTPLETPTPVPAPVREIDPARVTPGLLGLAFFVALFVGLFFLMRSFTRQLRKIDIPEEGIPIDHPRRRDHGSE